MKCITDAWDRHENELRKYLHRQVNDPVLAEDLLQDVFTKALTQGNKFCELDNSRAWLYRVAKNRIIDFRRTHKNYDEVDDAHPEEKDFKEPVVNLSKCLPAALKKLNAQDKEIIELCDLDGMSHADYAEKKQLTLTATKSRIQRARKRLKAELHKACQIVLDEMGNVCCFDPNCQ
ncbi:MAG: sigma-70 family RNA polymerase sigma factor [Gammaproteobacteria bacterium]|nr:sigma-70 family RNA polymerase sigma factor [Gammaproteobacteria bacterium]